MEVLLQGSYLMKSAIFILLTSFMLGQSYPVSNLGEDIRAEQATEVTLSGDLSYSIGDGNSIVEYVWSVNSELKDKILESNPGLASSDSAINGYYDIVTTSSTSILSSLLTSPVLAE